MLVNRRVDDALYTHRKHDVHITTGFDARNETALGTKTCPGGSITC